MKMSQITWTILCTASLIGVLTMPSGSAMDCPNNCTCHSVITDETTYSLECVGLPETIPNGVSALSVYELHDSILHTDELHQYTNIQVLNMSNLGIVGIDGTADQKNLWNLKSLLLARNRLLHLNATTFTSCPNVVKLELNDNGIKSIHQQTFSSLRRLQQLNLAGNKLLNLQFDLPQSLIALDVRNNQLEEAVLESGSLPRLMELNLCGNEYAMFSTGNLRVPALHTLCLGDSISSIEPNSLSTLPNLTSLTIIGKHSLNVTAEREFQKLTRLQSLTLSYLNFPTVSRELLSSCPSLQELRLIEIESANGFESGALRSMANLTLLDLRRSPTLVASLLALMNTEWVSRQDGPTFIDGPTLTYLDISENWLTCNADLQELLRAVLRDRIRLLSLNETVCAAPHPVAGKRLLDLESVQQILSPSSRIELNNSSNSNATNSTETSTDKSGIYYYLDHWGITTDDLLYTILALAITVLALLMALLIVIHLKCRQSSNYRPQNDGSDESFMMRADSEYTFDNFTLSETMAECRRSPTSTLNKNRKASQK